MRTAFAAIVFLSAVALIHAQPAKEPVPRYGIPARLKFYPQDTPKAALKSAVELIGKGEYGYLVAHVLDAKFVDERVADRAKLFEAAAERDLAALREFQITNPDTVTADNRVPLDPVEFRATAAVKARDRGFKQFLKDIEQKLADDPQTMKDMRKILSDGMFAETEPTASATHPDVKGRTLYFKKIGSRWFIENRQAEEPKKNEEPKKDP